MDLIFNSIKNKTVYLQGLDFAHPIKSLARKTKNFMEAEKKSIKWKKNAFF